MFGFVSLFSPKFWCPDASWVSGSLNLYLMLLLLSRESFIFQIADVHLLHSATRWRLLGQKYLSTALALMDHPNIAKVLDAGATETARHSSQEVGRTPSTSGIL